jgi:hypothetical protein
VTNVELCGDCIAHINQWNDRCTQWRNAIFLKNLVQEYKLQVINDDEDTFFTTRDGNQVRLTINVTLANGELCNNLMVETLTFDYDAILSAPIMVQVWYGKESLGDGTSNIITG